MLLAQVQDTGIALSKEQLAILADTGDKVDSSPDCDEVPTVQASFMANFSNHNLDVISEVPTYNTNHDNHVFEQNVQEMQDYEQQAFVDDSNDKFTKQAFWLPLSNPNSEQPNVTQTPVRFEVHKELPKHIICQDVVNTVMHADVKFDNVLPVPNTFLDDNIALDMMKMENGHLMELLVSQDLVHNAVNSLAVINDYQSMEINYIEEYEKNLKLAAELS
ncbi:hypothetical protein Tco_1376734 [Tanacetum coccineum]